jgi:isopenicillin N synthase-like dioxygenase
MAENVVPTIDLEMLADDLPPASVVQDIARAAETYGFFQVVNHGISQDQIDAVWSATRSFFAQDQVAKRSLSRTKQNTRGYYDRELTKNARDLKEVLDLAQLPFPDLPDDHPSNLHSIDGKNQWPEIDGFRSTVENYLDDCKTLALWLLSSFCLGLDEDALALHSAFHPTHTSFLRLNHYPIDDLLSPTEADGVTSLGDMALHHHTDAGALTLLLQDDVGGLQVFAGDDWIDVPAERGAIVVNTGDIMQVWSNDRFTAALHRVLPRQGVPRDSLPYFFNPSYDTDYRPLPGSIGSGDEPHYRTINWGDFRQARADGDFADYGHELQIADFRRI